LIGSETNNSQGKVQTTPVAVSAISRVSSTGRPRTPLLSSSRTIVIDTKRLSL
jgi:hypothetical protein